MQLDTQYYDLMRANPVFQDLTENDFLQVTEHTRLSTYDMGDTIFRQRDPAYDFFFLIKGKIKLSLLSFEGNEKVVDIINEGNTFAEAIMFRGAPHYPVNAEAVSDVKLLSINADTYTKILHSSPDACFKVMACLSVRIHGLMNEIDRISLHSATYRLISYFLETVPDNKTSATEIHLSIPKRVIASRLSVTPETFSRTLKHLSDQGLLKVKDDHIVLNNPTELRRMISI